MKLRYAIPLAFFCVIVLFYPYDPYTMEIELAYSGPQGSAFLGYDSLGRDLLSRIVYGMGTSLIVAVGVVVFTGLIGVAIGLIAGWCGGKVDTLLMRFADIVLSLPGILVAVMFVALSEPSIFNIILALSLTGWVGFARLARVQTQIIKKADFVTASSLLGVSSFGILMRHILPNISTVLFVEGLFTAVGAMMAEAGLSFLGVGLAPPTPSLGSLLKEGAGAIMIAPHIVVCSGAGLAILLLVFSWIGERLKLRVSR